MYMMILALPLLEFKLGFLNLNTIDFGGWKIFVLRSCCSVCCRMVSNIPGLYPSPSREN